MVISILLTIVAVCYYIFSLFALCTFKEHIATVNAYKVLIEDDDIDIAKFVVWLLSLIVFMMIIFPLIVHPIHLIRKIPFRRIWDGVDYLRSFPLDALSIFFGYMFKAAKTGIKAK
jgi:hypothetical protein